MTRNRIAASVVLVVMIGGTALGLRAAHQVEEGRLTLDRIPAAARAAFATIAGDAPASGVERLRGGVVAAYEIEFDRNGAESGVVVSELGDVIEIETALPAGDLPSAVREGLDRAFPGATIAEAESVELHFFEVELMHDGKMREVRISATGRVARSNDDGESDGESADDPDDGSDDPDDDSDDPDSEDDRSEDPGEK